MNAPYAPQQGQPIASPQMPTAMPSPGMVAPAPAPVTHDVTIITTKKLAQAKVIGCPPEEFGIERNARNIRDCNYCFHEVVTKTVSQLVAEGFDEEQIKALTEYTGLTEVETLTRDTEQEHLGIQGEGINPAARAVKITEHYVRMDYEGNGRPCLYQVITGGDQGEILRKDGKESITPFDAIPFAVWTPVPQPHRFFGRSIAELVMPAQREKTALKRGALDNMYLHNNPRPEISQSHANENTIDDLLVSRHGAPIRTKQPGGLNWQVVPDITGSIYPMMQYIDAELETRTGLTKQGQGIDANALQNQSATAVAQAFTASQMRLKLVARHLAEGVKDICALLHATIRKHGQEAQTVRLRNTWVEVDPRNWKTRNDMTINVGLGTGSKAQQFGQLSMIAGFQEKLLAGGKLNLVDDTNIWNLVSEMSKLAGHPNAEKFFSDPTAKDPQTGQLLHPPVPPPPDPKVQAAQMKAQTDQQANQQKAQLEQQKAQNDAVHQQVKAQAEIELARIKADLEAKLKIIDAHVKAVEAEQKARHAQQQHHADMVGTVVDLAATAHKHDMSMEQGQQAHDARLAQMKSQPKADA